MKKLMMMVGVMSASVFAMNVDVNQQLHDAALRGDLAGVQDALEKEANVNAKIAGRTALHQAARFGSLEVVNALITAKAAIDPKDETGKTPLFIAVMNLGQEGNGANHEAVALKLIALGADVNVMDQHDGTSPLMYAVRRGSPALVKAFIDKKANVNAWDQEAETALSRAERRGNAQIIEMLKKAGAM